MDKLQWNKAFALEQAADDADLLKELLDIFKTSFGSDCLLIQQGVHEENAQKIASAAHSIKGASASLGFDGLTQLARAIEAECKSGNISIARDSLPDLQIMQQELQEML